MSERSVPFVPQGRLEGRRSRRIAVGERTRFATAGGVEHVCILADVSVDGVALETEAKIHVGERVRVDLPEVGVVEGSVSRTSPGFLALTLHLSGARRSRLERRIEASAAREPVTTAPSPLSFANVATDEDIRRLRENLSAVVSHLMRISRAPPRESSSFGSARDLDSNPARHAP